MKKDTYEFIISNCPATPIEIGGILGSKSGIVIEYALDCGMKEYGKYTPNTAFLNKTIQDWHVDGIDFCGIFHTHYPENNELSRDDIEYIRKIMISMCTYYNSLYFPIVIPFKDITVYKAEIIEGKVNIKKDKIVLIN